MVTILKHDPRWVDVIAFNEHSGAIVKRKAPPFPSQSEVGEWTDDDDIRLKWWLASNYGIRGLRRDEMQGAVFIISDFNRYHEIKDYLNGLEWDGVKRLQHWLHGYLGAEPSEYHSLVGVKFLVAAVARVLNTPRPTFVKNVLILEGPQDAGKSTSARVLFEPWFTDAAFEIGSTDGMQIIRGQWGVELSELDSFSRAENTRSKSFFSRETDRYRNPYGKKPVDVVRQCVFIGSTNQATYLKDETGNARYWPVKIGRIDVDELRKDKAQLWAEAVHEFNSGTVWYVTAAERPIFEDEQERRYVGDAWEERIKSWLDGKVTGGAPAMPRDDCTSEDVLRGLGLDVRDWNLPNQQRVGKIMARLGWERQRKNTAEREWFYVRPKKKPTG